jgi:hypothetical protein
MMAALAELYDTDALGRCVQCSSGAPGPVAGKLPNIVSVVSLTLWGICPHPGRAWRGMCYDIVGCFRPDLSRRILNV